MSKHTLNRLYLLVLSSAAFLSVLDIFIVNVALPAIRKGTGGTYGDSQLVIALYLLGYAAFLITGGRAGDRYGQKKVFVLSMIMFTLASAACGIAQTAAQLNMARFLQGLGAAFMVPQSIALIQVLFPLPAERIRAMGIYGSIAGIASVAGQFLGGLLPGLHFLTGGWRLIFLINLPLGLLAAFLAWRILPVHQAEAKPRFDYTGVAGLTAGLVCLIYPLIQGRELGWPAWSIAMLAAAGPLLLLFVQDQRSKLAAGRTPLINMQLFHFRSFNLGLGAALFYFLVQDTYFMINAVLFESGFGFSSADTGRLFVCQGAGFVCASLLSIRLLDRYGKKVVQSGVLLMILTLWLHLCLFRSFLTPQWIFQATLFVYGLGCGSVLPSLMTLALQHLPPRFAGAAAGTYTTFQQTAVALGICFTGGIFFEALGPAVQLDGYLQAYRTATLLNMVLLAAVSVFLYLLPLKKS